MIWCKFFKNNCKQLREVTPLGTASLHKLSPPPRTDKIWSLQSAGLTGRNSKIAASWDWPRCVCTWMIVKSYVVRDIYSNEAVDSFVKENEILDFWIVSKRQHIQGEHRPGFKLKIPMVPRTLNLLNLNFWCLLGRRPDFCSVTRVGLHNI